jgi:hypothetical protein
MSSSLKIKSDRDLIFRNGPYFMGTRGMYLNQWTPDFSPENDIPSVVPVWVRLPFLPLHCWNDETIKNIGNALGRFIDRVEPHDRLQSFAHLCVEVDLEKGLPEAIQLTLDGWSYIQTVDYEQLPFKCKSYHEYGHFAKKCPKASSKNPENKAPEQWKPTKRKKVTNKSGVQSQERRANTRPSSPIKGKSPMQNNNEAESNKNRYDPLENLEAETYHSKENTEEIQSQQAPDPDPPSLQNEPDAPLLMDPSHGLEDESQEDSGEELDMELLKSAKSSKAGRKTNRNKREKVANQDKEIGTQPTLEEVLKKEGKSGKAPTTKGQSQPTKGGATKHASK